MASCPVRAEQVLEGHGRPLRTTLSRPSDCAKYEIALDVALHFGPEDHSCAEKLNKNNDQVGRETLQLFKSGPGRRHHRESPPRRAGRQRGTSRQAMGRSKGGLTTKILALTDALGNLVRFVLLPGQRFDTVGVPPLIDGLAFGALIGDTAFDSNDIIADLNERGAKAVIAQHPRRTTPLDIDREMYKWRH